MAARVFIRVILALRMKNALILLALLTTACSYYQQPSDAEAEIVRPGAFIPGSGVITQISVLRNQNKGEPDPNLYRISIRIDISGYQEVDIDSNTFFVGEAVELTNDGRILHVSGTTFKGRTP